MQRRLQGCVTRDNLTLRRDGGGDFVLTILSAFILPPFERLIYERFAGILRGLVGRTERQDSGELFGSVSSRLPIGWKPDPFHARHNSGLALHNKKVSPDLCWRITQTVYHFHLD